MGHTTVIEEFAAVGPADSNRLLEDSIRLGTKGPLGSLLALPVSCRVPFSENPLGYRAREQCELPLYQVCRNSQLSTPELSKWEDPLSQREHHRI